MEQPHRDDAYELNATAAAPAATTAAAAAPDATAPPPAKSIINNGSISGVLPEAEALAVHYPGYPSTARAIETLGGLHKISKAWISALQNQGGSQDFDKDRRRFLELKFRPEDPYCHPAFGEPRSSSSLLLRIVRTRNEDAAACAGASPAPVKQLSADVVARISLSYHFEGMADYQHVIAIHAAETRTKKRRWTLGHRSCLDGDANVDMDHGDLMMLAPPLFARKDKPEKIVLNPPATLLSENFLRGAVEYTWEMDIELCHAIPFSIKNILASTLISMHVQYFLALLHSSKIFFIFCFSLLNLSFIKIPEKINWEDRLPKGTPEWEAQVAVSKLFEERPIWPRWSLHERLLDDGQETTDYLLRRLLLRTGYYFSSGPFGKFWIKKGYDPRVDPDSRIYQKVDFRMPPNLKILNDMNANSPLKCKWKDICKFQVWPSTASKFLQLFELDDDYIHQEIEKPTSQAICTSSTGWFSEAMLKALRLRVMIRFLSVAPNGAPEELLKSKIEEFNRATKKEVLSKFWKPEKEEHWLGDQDASNHQRLCNTYDVAESELVENDVHHIEDEDDYEEEEEEELDGYESPQLAGEDGAPSYTTTYENGESIPDEYLQELLSGFSYSKYGKDQKPGEGDVQAAGYSDDEYQIYERDTDDDNTDD